MPNCRICGRHAGLFWDVHDECQKAVDLGKTAEEVQRTGALPAVSRPLTAFGVFWAVFLALCLYGIVAGIVGEFLHEVSR